MKTIMEEFGEIEQQAADLKAQMIEAGMPVPLEVKSDEAEHQIIINGVLCDYCGEKKAAHEVPTSTSYDQAICDDCWEHFN